MHRRRVTHTSGLNVRAVAGRPNVCEDLPGPELGQRLVSSVIFTSGLHGHPLWPEPWGYAAHHMCAAFARYCVVAVLVAPRGCNLRGRELSPGLPRDGRKY